MNMSVSSNTVLTSLSKIMTALNQIQAGALITDKNKRIMNMNRTAEAFTGWPLDDCGGMNLFEVLRLSESGNQTVLTSRSNEQMHVTVQTSLHSCPEMQEEYYFIIIMSNAKTHVKSRLLEVSENNLRIIFDSVYDAIIIHDLQGNILDVNKKMVEMYHIGNMDVTKMTIMEDLSDKNNPFEKLPEIWESVVSGESRLFEWIAKRPSDGSVFDVEVYLTRIALYHQDAILANVRDISGKKQSEQMIQYLSFHDKLTGLYNRAFFEKELIRLDTERQLPISIIIADVNGLKLANDAFGHLLGDELLKLAGEVLKKASHQDDIVARWGGDEFAAILTNTDAQAAAEICERIQNECIKAELKPISLSIALGHATKTEGKQDIFDIIKEAETVMYANKLRDGKANRQKIINGLLARQTEWDHDFGLMMKLCTLLAGTYGLEESKLADIELFASIHDIGKVSIPVEILAKSGPLSEEEWKMVKKHSEIGYRIASTYPEYVHLADAILTHHERWDGTGYPRRLKGEEIPIEARILSIVDAYDAIVSGRPYRAARSHSEALEEILRHSGSQFDPKLVDVFINLPEDWLR